MMMPKPDPPCYKCETRRVGCHSECRKYIEFQKDRRQTYHAIASQLKGENQVREFTVQSHRRRRKIKGLE